jgi:hypothetical protein
MSTIEPMGSEVIMSENTLTLRNILAASSINNIILWQG